MARLGDCLSSGRMVMQPQERGPAMTDVETPMRQRRLLLGITQLGLSDVTGIAQARLSNLENGKVSRIGLREAMKIAKALDTTVEDLFEAAVVDAEGATNG